MIQIKDLQLPDVVQSPMANCTDLPFRLTARAFGMRFAYLEMISSEALVRDSKETLKMMQTTPEDRPVGCQLVGCNPEVMGEAAAIVESMGFPLVDINLGCPVPKVVSPGAGSQLLREPEKARQIFTAMLRAVRRVPVTVKMRLGFNNPTGEEAAHIARIAEDCGIGALAVHGRTRAQGYTGTADYEAIGRIKAAVSIPVYGNGDVVHGSSARRLLEVSGCDGVMLGRGALGNPWIYRQIDAAMRNEAPPAPPTLAERKTAALQHIELQCRYDVLAGRRSPGEGPLGPLRRIVCWYFVGVPGVRRFRERVMHTPSVDELRELVHLFSPDPAGDQQEISPAGDASAV